MNLGCPMSILNIQVGQPFLAALASKSRRRKAKGIDSKRAKRTARAL